MAFTYTVEKRTSGAGGRIISGTYTSTAADTGGDIYTELQTIYSFGLQPKSTAVVADQPAVNETLPLAVDGITIVTTANETGTWFAVGE